jgi:hypothetical protein
MIVRIVWMVRMVEIVAFSLLAFQLPSLQAENG